MATTTQGRWAAAPARGSMPPHAAPPHAAPPTKRTWSWRVGTVGGIDLYVHATFVLLLAWVALGHWAAHHSAVEALRGVLLISTVFAIVVLHELGHALTAKRFGIRTFDITLLPIGGIARLERMPEDPKQELLVAIAGPAVNVVLAGVFLGLSVLLREPLDSTQLATAGPFFPQLMWINVGLAVFNMLPAFPMDGGRVLRAVLAMRMPHMRATDAAARLGQALALGLGLVGLFFNPVLVFVALFVWMGAREEAAAEHVRFSLQGIRVGDAMVTGFGVLLPHETVDHAVDHVLSGFQEDFPVVDGDAVVGILTRADLLRAIAAGRRDAAVHEVMKPGVAVVELDEPLHEALQRLGPSAGHAVPVVHRGTLVGLLTAERIGEIVMMRSS